LLDAPKAYTATIRFGATTTTGDAEGEVREKREVRATREGLTEVLRRFIGEQDQLPPMYSALKYQGRAYYEHARAGREIPREPRRIAIHALDLVDWSSPDAIVSVRCSKGTYIRVLAEDIGEAMGCGAHLAALRRTQSGPFRVDDAVSLRALEAMQPDALDALLLDVDAPLADLPVLRVDADEVRSLREGKELSTAEPGPGPYRAYGPSGFTGVVEIAEGRVRAVRLTRPD
jgi:tRNA pseudouridine55 synthase